MSGEGQENIDPSCLRPGRAYKANPSRFDLIPASVPTMSTVTATGTIEPVVDAAAVTDNSTNELQVPPTDRKKQQP